MFTVSLTNILVFDSEELKQKKNMFIKKSADIIIGCHSRLYNSLTYVIRKDFIEITDRSMINELKQSFNNHQFGISSNNDRVTTESIFITNFVTGIKRLTVDFNTDSLKKMVLILSGSSVKVDFLRMWNVQNYDDEFI